MFNRRIAATLGVIALVLAACTGGGDESSSPPHSEPAGSERSVGCSRGRLHGRRVVEQLPAAALGGQGQAEHPGDGRGRRRHLHRRRCRTSTPTQQLTDVETFISQGADVLILLAQDTEAVLPGVSRRPRTPASRSSRMTA